MVVIRAASAADAAQVAAVQREAWFAAYEGIIPSEIIDRVTAPDDGARVRQTFRTRPWQHMLVAVAADQATPGPTGEPAASGIVGYASFGTTGAPAGSTSGPVSRRTAPPTCSFALAASPNFVTAGPWIPSSTLLYTSASGFQKNYLLVLSVTTMSAETSRQCQCGVTKC